MVATQTIKFNVGGRHFEVSRDLMEQHSETMLGKLVSEAWQEDPEQPVFIDRDGDIFAHILNYLRYGRIELPSNVPKSSFKQDLDFYGIVPEEGAVKQESIADVHYSLWLDCQVSKQKHDACIEKYNAFRLAFEVSHQYISQTQKEYNHNRQHVTINVRDLYKNITQGNSFPKVSKLFNDYLDEYYGLDCGEMNQYGNCKISKK